MKETVLLTGGAGFIGSHIAVELLQRDYNVVIADDLSNARPDVPERIRQITGRAPAFYHMDAADRPALDRVFREHPIAAAVHLAGYKAVGESVQKPLAYYRNNLDTTLALLDVMADHGVHRLIFSSSATVYGDAPAPCREDMPTGGCTNPYAWTKLMIEQILRDAAKADPALSAVCLRYFNPVGAHESGLIGEAAQRHSQQSDALHHPDRRRYPTGADGVRQRLSHSRRHRRPGLYPRGGSGPGPCGGAGVFPDQPGLGGHQPGHRPGQQRAGDRGDVSSGSTAWRCLTASAPGGPGICPPAMPPRTRRRSCCTGTRKRTWPTCAGTPGAGSRASINNAHNSGPVWALPVPARSIRKRRFFMMPIRSRAAAAAVHILTALCAAVGVVLQCGFIGGKLNLAVLQYFTLMSNILCAVYFTGAAVHTLRRGGTWLPVCKGALVMAMAITGITFHLVLAAGDFSMGPTQLITNHLLHTAAPLLTVLDWLLFDEKGRYRWFEPFLWGIFPSAYFVYTMIRARVSSFRFYNGSPYPYAFMDVDALGWGKVLLIFLGMAAAFLAFGYVLVWLDHLLARRRRA